MYVCSAFSHYWGLTDLSGLLLFPSITASVSPSFSHWGLLQQGIRPCLSKREQHSLTIPVAASSSPVLQVVVEK